MTSVAKAAGKFAARLAKQVNKKAQSVGRALAQGGEGGEEGEREEEQRERPGKKGKIKALLATLDNGVVVVYKAGVVEKYSDLARLLWSWRAPCELHCGVVVGRSVWLGCSDGGVRVVDGVNGQQTAGWPAHLFRVRGLALCGSSVFTLAADGAVRGWPAVQPPPPAAVTAWKEGAREGLRVHNLRVLAGTWNVAEQRPDTNWSVRTWLGERSGRADIVCVGLQELEVGTSSVALDAARSVLNRAALEKGNANAQWWADLLGSALAGGADGGWVRVALRQMSGMLAVVWVRQQLAPHVGEVATASVACGVLGVGGNKGCVAVSMTLFRRRFVFIASHFAAHQERVEERNADYARIVRTLHFEGAPKAGPPAKAAAASTSSSQHPAELKQQLTGVDASRHGSVSGASVADALGGGGDTADVAPSLTAAGPPALGHGPGVTDAEVLVWAGDFNYRIAAPCDYVCDRVAGGDVATLVALDQLRREMARGAVFHGLSEGPLLFAPTYKFDRGVPVGLAGGGELSDAQWSTIGALHPLEQLPLLRLPYDSSEKRRIPAWTDRVLWRGSLPPLPGQEAAPEEAVVVALRRGQGGGDAYGCVLGAVDSDHKPVHCELEVALPAYIQDHKRRHSLAVLRGIAAEITPTMPPALALALPPSQQPHQAPGSLPLVVLRGEAGDQVALTNTCPLPVAMVVGGDGGGGGAKLPLWLEVLPASVVLPPHGTVTLTLRGPTPDASLSSGSPSLSGAREGLLRVYTQHLACVGTGSLTTLAPGSAPALLRVRHLPY
uniref:Inositol polyphosphate-related phosphatase domain-containing protein n=1 Tax=Chlamydomonas leiostraca TaxID=1034604 RepID=A0A7S0S3D7_9CHLO|mmetsp:Transcript_5836/g.14509  ORF Transcript_5836/g.14509 Transcript_5836/m.14509 type:complete len:781 (+) Transcript_5836:1-2343(+)